MAAFPILVYRLQLSLPICLTAHQNWKARVTGVKQWLWDWQKVKTSALKLFTLANLHYQPNYLVIPPPLPPRSTAVSLKTWPSSTVCNWPLVGRKSGFLPLTRLAQVISSKTLKNESLKSGSNREGTSYQKTGFFSGWKKACETPRKLTLQYLRCALRILTSNSVAWIILWNLFSVHERTKTERRGTEKRCDRQEDQTQS